MKRPAESLWPVEDLGCLSHSVELARFTIGDRCKHGLPSYPHLDAPSSHTKTRLIAAMSCDVQYRVQNFRCRALV
jgi:hypothetical protein